MSAPRRLEVSAEVLLHRSLDPFLRIGGLGHPERHGRARRGQHGVLHVGDLAQELLCGGELALGGDQVGGGRVACGARFLHVGDGDEAHLEALVGLLELTRDGIERGLLGLDVVLGGEHVEITRGHAQCQVLLRDAVVRIRLRDDPSGLLQAHQLAPVEDALVELQAPAGALGLGRADLRLLLDDHRRVEVVGIGRYQTREQAVLRLFVPALGPLAADLRQVQRPGLRLGFAGRLARVFGFAHQRVVDDGLIKDGEEVFAGCGDRDQASQPQGE